MSDKSAGTAIKSEAGGISLVLPSGIRIEGITTDNIDMVAGLASRL
jgi:hypothetical protein